MHNMEFINIIRQFLFYIYFVFYRICIINQYIYQYDTASDTKNAILEKINGILEELEFKTHEKDKADKNSCRDSGRS